MTFLANRVITRFNSLAVRGYICMAFLSRKVGGRYIGWIGRERDRLMNLIGESIGRVNFAAV